jgi:proteasome lid subunit RPN8/RPN11
MIKKETKDKINEYRKNNPNTWIMLIGDGHTVIDFINAKDSGSFKETTDKKIMGRMMLEPVDEKTTEIPLSVDKNNASPWRRNYVSNFPSYKKPDEDSTWEVKLDCVKECSKAPKEVVISLKPIVKMKIDALMNKYKNQEWLGYYIGKPGEYIVYDLVIPEQKASGASVNNVNFSVPEGMSIIGVVHSHHNMFNDFSSTDHEWINQNHNISTVVTHQNSKTQVRVKTSCGAFIIVPGKLKVVYDIEFDEEKFIKESDNKINPPTVTPTNVGEDFGNFYGYGEGFFREGGDDNSPQSIKETKKEMAKEDEENEKDGVVEKVELTPEYNPPRCVHHYMITKYTGESTDGCRCTKIVGSYCTGFTVKCKYFEKKDEWDSGFSSRIKCVEIDN